MKIRYTIVFFLTAFLFSAEAQDHLSIQLDYANNLFNNKQYFDAITEYKRFQFFDSTKTFDYEANNKIGECYKAGAKYDDAIKYFSFAEQNARSDDEYFDSKTQIIRTNILRRTTARALQLCNELEKDQRISGKSDEINYWRGWAFIFEDDWENAAKSFTKINSKHELKILAEQTDKAKVSVTFAKVISYILPGSGAIYSGKILSGLMSLGWNLLAGYWTVNSFIEDRVFDGIVVGELVWLRFYRGAIQNAETFAIEKNIEVANKSLRYLQNEYKGIKP
jgi:tetratricopeptide (TPR) repeat protein